MSFKIPSVIPQDLLMIQEMVSSGERRQEPDSKTELDSSDPEDSSSTDLDSDLDSSSEDELKIDESLQVVKPDSDVEDVETLKDVAPSPSEDSDSDSSDSDSEDSEEDGPHFVQNSKNEISDDEEEVTGTSIPASGVRSKNEIAETAIVPEVETVGPDERLEKVGEIMSVFESVVVVRGIPSDTKNAAERALDSESLLVFEDRMVLGYVHETFGPTQQPFYQIKFPSPLAINLELVTVGKAVFHLPDRSNFVFPSQLRMYKGSDASNVHDEEVGEDELEFSDDEAEMAFRRQRKRNDRGRSSSVASSRFSTPLPSHLRDQDLMGETHYDATPYDEFGPYNMDSEAGPSRPSPLPYDDPYQDTPRPPSPTSSVMSDVQSHYDDRSVSYGEQANGMRGRGRGRGRGGARGRGRDGGPGNRGRGDRRVGREEGDSRPFYQQRGRERGRSISNPPVPPSPRSLSPTSLAIARATGQYSDGSAFQDLMSPPTPQSPHERQSASWNTQGSFVQFAAAQQGYHAQPFQQPAADFVQPHINPRFASMFGINMPFMQQQQQYSPFQPSMIGNGWNGVWVPPSTGPPGNTTEKGAEHAMETSGGSQT